MKDPLVCHWLQQIPHAFVWRNEDEICVVNFSLLAPQIQVLKKPKGESPTNLKSNNFLFI